MVTLINTETFMSKNIFEFIPSFKTKVWTVNSKYEIYKGQNIKNASGGVNIIKYI